MGTEAETSRSVAQQQDDPLTREIIGGAIEVHRTLGSGLLEHAYEHCLAIELAHRGLDVQRQVPLSMQYRGVQINQAYRMDMVVGRRVVVEVKALDAVLPVHEAQLLTSMKLAKLHVGLLLNFHVPLMTKGITRRVL